MSKKITTLGKIISEAGRSSNVDMERNELIGQMQEELAQHRAEERKKEIYESLKSEVQKETGTEKWFEKINWHEYSEHHELVIEKLNEIAAYLHSESLSDDEKGIYLTNQRNKYLRKLTKSTIGRELMNGYEVHIFLQLFIDQKDVIITGKDGESYAPWLNKKGKSRQKVSKDFAAYTAIQGMLKGNPSLNANSDAKQKAIIKDLVEEGIIENQLERENYDLKSAVRYLKMRESTFRKYLGEEKIQGGKVGRKWIFTKAQLDEFIKQHKTVAEIDLEVEKMILKRKSTTKD